MLLSRPLSLSPLRSLCAPLCRFLAASRRRRTPGKNRTKPLTPNTKPQAPNLKHQTPNTEHHATNLAHSFCPSCVQDRLLHMAMLLGPPSSWCLCLPLRSSVVIAGAGAGALLLPLLALLSLPHLQLDRAHRFVQ